VGVGVGGDLIVDDACFKAREYQWHRLGGEFSAHDSDKSTNHTHCHEARARVFGTHSVFWE
jgi:hypothetical protein